MNEITEVTSSGRQFWLKYIRRNFIRSGSLRELIGQGLRGITFDIPTFERTIAGSADYDEVLEKLSGKKRSTREISEQLVMEDAREAADALRPVYDVTEKRAGYVSLEIAPELVRDAEDTIAEGRRLFHFLDRPNIMIRIAATQEGLAAISRSVASGISVNATFIFSMAQYEAATEAYLSGLEALIAQGGDPGRVTSVASVVVGPMDAAIDRKLKGHGESDLLGRIATDNARLLYDRFQTIFRSKRWRKLEKKGARIQNLIFEDAEDLRYFKNLTGPEAAISLSPDALRTFLDQAGEETNAGEDLKDSRIRMERLSELKIDLDEISNDLQRDGILALSRAFEDLLSAVEKKIQALRAGWHRLSLRAGGMEDIVEGSLRTLGNRKIMRRIWEHDFTVWKTEPREIADRLEWLHLPVRMESAVGDLTTFATEIRDGGFSSVLLLGMGGSSLAPEVYGKVFARGPGLHLEILDSTDPDAVLAVAKRTDPRVTLFIVSTKSGKTVETLSLFSYFYELAFNALGEKAGSHFVAITDPGSHLADLAGQYHFRRIFLNEPDLGGRYSALSHFGLVPAALVGVDLSELLQRSRIAASNAEECNCPVLGDNDAARLGVILGESALAGRDKATLIASPEFAPLCDWIEQLIAESTGKDGRGILPVVGEPLGDPCLYGRDRLFIHLRMDGDERSDAGMNLLAGAGHPVVVLRLKDRYDLGGQFFLWEMAVAVAGEILGVNPFDQPDVEASKRLARRMMNEYEKVGKLPETAPALSRKGISVYGKTSAETPEGALGDFLAAASPGDYASIQAYVAPSPEMDEALAGLRRTIRDRWRIATTSGYGPRLLHSTGQLHKGDSGRGLFIQLLDEDREDVPIPETADFRDSKLTFGVLKTAQALGDGEALRKRARRVLRLHLGAGAPEKIRILTLAISSK